MAETNLTQRIAHCIEMASEITEENARRYSLASVLTEELDTFVSFRLIEQVSGKLKSLLAVLQETKLKTRQLFVIFMK